MSWTPLQVYSQYSLLSATATVCQLAKAAAADGMKSLALTDQGNLHGAVDHFLACQQASIKALIGCELAIVNYSCQEKRKDLPPATPIVLIALNAQGYKNLCALSSAAHLQGFYYQPRIDRQLLAKHCQGLLCLSGMVGTTLAHALFAEDHQEVDKEIDWYRSLFADNYALTLQRHLMADEEIKADGLSDESWKLQNYYSYINEQEKLNERVWSLSQTKNLRCVATQGSRYIKREDWKALEIAMNIHAGNSRQVWQTDSRGQRKSKMLNPKRKTQHSHAFHFRSQQEMAELFADKSEAIAMSNELASLSTFQLAIGQKHYPIFIPPGTFSDEKQRKELIGSYLHKLCIDGLAKRYPQQTDDKDIHQRLNKELEVIIGKGLSDYLLVVWDLVIWAKRQGIPIGPGRGSGAGSLVLYLLEVTDIEPLRFGLFFERFINPERPSFPDIDIDICMERRSELIEYVADKYGHDKVAHLITFGTMKAKMALRDVGRVLALPLPLINELIKLIPDELNITLDKALKGELGERYNQDREIAELIDLAKKLEGSIRNTGTHAAGLVISDIPLCGHVPLCRSKDSDIAITQYAMHPIESVGLLKIDLLGLKTLTCIEKCIQSLDIDIDWKALPLDDPAAFALLNSPHTQGLFQVESAGMQDLLRKLEVNRFEEIIAVGALYRPGPMEMIPSFIARKHGREDIELEDPALKTILAETYGIMVYQEQVMQIAVQLAGYSLGEGDVLRRAMGKKDHKEMEQQRDKFCQGAIHQGMDISTAQSIFHKIEKFASYGYNKSHAAAYGYLTYVTAYLKGNYPKAWMAAQLTCDRDDRSKVTKIITQCQAMGIDILPPNLNRSKAEFTATDGGITFALSAIKGVGNAAVEEIMKKRDDGVFTSLADFVQRVDLQKISKKTIEALIEAGAFDFTDRGRSKLLTEVIDLVGATARQQREKAMGIQQLFLWQPEGGDVVDIPAEELLRKEKDRLGFFLTGQPFDGYEKLISEAKCQTFAELRHHPLGTTHPTVFFIEDIQVKGRLTVLHVSHRWEQGEVYLWAELYQQRSHLCRKRDGSYGFSNYRGR